MIHHIVSHIVELCIEACVTKEDIKFLHYEKMLGSVRWIFWNSRRKTTTLDMKDNTFSNLEVDLGTHTQGRPEGKGIMKASPATKRDELTTSVSTWDLFSAQVKNFKMFKWDNVQNMTAIFCPGNTIGQGKGLRGRDWNALDRKMQTCIQHSQSAFQSSVNASLRKCRSTRTSHSKMSQCCLFLIHFNKVKAKNVVFTWLLLNQTVIQV